MKLIRFFAEKQYFNLGQPMPTKKFIPEWYRKAESTYTDPSGEIGPGLKKCMPYMDTLVSGYVLRTPVNIYINEEKINSSLSHIFGNVEGNLRIRWDGPESLANFIMERPEQSGATIPRPAGHYHNHLVFSEFWSAKTPRGWSMLMTHPLNRHDLPFTTVSGIIDSDKFWSPGNIPFFVKKGFSGMIPEGTPFAQLIPIKRSAWKMILDEGLADSNMKQASIVRNKGTEYKKIMWQRKKYD
jgi:hypothetical protein